jgi:AraC-like DNA-binding protein
MNIVTLKTSNLEQTFKQLNIDLGGTLEVLPKECRLELDTDFVKGEVYGMSINKNITFFQYDVTFGEDLLIVNNTPVTNPISFLYCAEGQLTHSFGANGKKRFLNRFQTGIFASDPSRDTTLFFRKDQTVKLSLITVNTHAKGIEDDNINLLQKQLIETFMPIHGVETLAYMGSYNLKISEKMQQLETVKENGLVRRLLIKGIVHVILALEIQQHKEDLKSKRNNLGGLTRDEMEEIKELSLFIKNYPEIDYSIAYLTRKGGMSPAKLQKGFKLLHNSTVTNFIRNVRVEKAEELIRTTDLNISEVVYTIGLTSRSYFSKIFKEKYNCSPKYYQEHQNELAMTA